MKEKMRDHLEMRVRGEKYSGTVEIGGRTGHLRTQKGGPRGAEVGCTLSSAG